MFKETKKRSIFKSLSWRVVAVLNSWTVLSLMLTKSNFWNAIIMNVSGFIFFYIFERVWNKIKFGRIEE
jgi:uncharacterized membrane protein